VIVVPSCDPIDFLIRKAARGPPFFYRYSISSMIVRSRAQPHMSCFALDIPILAQRRRFPIDLIGKERISTESGKHARLPG